MTGTDSGTETGTGTGTEAGTETETGTEAEPEVRVDSRWWYWVAAVPLVTGFWLVSALWVAAVALVVPEAGATATGAVVSIPAVALGVPALVAFVALPLALLQDARAVERAGGDLPELAGRAPRLAAGALVLIVGGVAVYFEGSASVTSGHPLGALGILAGVVGGTWLAVAYLRARRRVVEMPGSLREWRRELGADDARR